MNPIRCHAAAGVALSNIHGQIKMLLMNRVKGSFWCHVAGTVESGETGWQSIVRECGEETGIKVTERYNGQIWSSVTMPPPIPSWWCLRSWSIARPIRW